MEQGWRLGAHWYGAVARLAVPDEAGGTRRACSWAVVRRDGEGPRCLLQLWEPCPPVKVLDGLREDFLQCFSRAEAMDTGGCHLGYDEAKAWFLQELAGMPLARVWERTGAAGRGQLRERLLGDLAGSRAPRLLLPEVMGVIPGRILAPRVLGPAPWDRDGLLALLDPAPPAAEEDGERRWNLPPDLADGSRLPMRGRGREFTYLKSLMFGIGTATPMERVLILQGEQGLGHDRLCDWAAAAAETEGIWVADLEIYPGERAGALLERLVAELIGGMEADLYAALPAVARALSRRMATFAFLRGGRRPDAQERLLETEEIAAALQALAFAQGRHPRLLLVRGLERAAAGVPTLLKDLVAGSELPWILSAREPGRNPELRSCLSLLKNSPAAATVVLDRLDDHHLGEVLADLLGPHDLPAGLLADIGAASLGNPGLMQSILEMAQLNGSLLWKDGRWLCSPDRAPVLEVQEDLVESILVGRLGRLNPAALALVRYLALADEPLPLATLGRAMGLDADAVEEALHAAASAKLAHHAPVDGSARIAGPKVRELAITRMPAREALRSAQVLLKILGEQGGKPLLSVRLQSFALDRETALAQVLKALEHERSAPQEAERIVQEALKLGPGPLAEARLWEFLADAWGRVQEGDAVAAQGPRDRSPDQSALAALDQAQRTLASAPCGWDEEERSARLHRKQGLLELRLRRFESARQSLGKAALLLSDHPFHPEQPRLRLAAGKLHMAQGAQKQAMAALEEGLELLRQKGAMDGHRDQVALLLALGRAQGEGAQFQGALATVEALRRLAEHHGDRRMRVEALAALGQVRLGLGQLDGAADCTDQAIGLARSLDDLELLAGCQLSQGILRSCQQFLGPALAFLDSSSRRFELLGDSVRAIQAQAWKARNLAALGDHGLAELLMMRVASAGTDLLTPAELAERVFLDAEIAGFVEAWGEARRNYLAAANRFEHAGLAWRDRLARLRCIQAEVLEAAGSGANLKPAWMRLEQLKGPVEGTGSRWLELEWHRAHALLLSAAGSEGPILVETLTAWGEVLAGARELKFPVLVLEAAARSSELLMGLGEKLGARSRIQDALPSFQALWTRLPEAFEQAFRGRKDIHGFRQAAARVGMRIPWPERTDPQADWTATRADLPPVAAFRVSP